MKRAGDILQGDLDLEKRLQDWRRSKAPLTHALLDRCHELMSRLANEEQRQRLNGVILMLSNSARRGLEVGAVAQREAAETLTRLGG